MLTYDDLLTAFSEREIRCKLKPEKLIVGVNDDDGNTWPDRSNSFWVTNVNSTWYLFTWLPAGYRIPDENELVDLCTDCMELDTAMYHVPSSLISKHSLVRLDGSQMELIFAEMAKRQA